MQFSKYKISNFEILKLIYANQCVLISTHTGSGKTTQLPRIILEDQLKKSRDQKCNVLVTEPRRIAAISAAIRVARERKERISDTVGYSVRFENKRPRSAEGITFCTTGLVMKMLTTDPWLNQYSHIIVDEDGVGGGVKDGISGCKGFVNGSKALKNENFQNLKSM